MARSLAMQAKIKIGAEIMHDRSFGTWPNCCPPISEYAGEEYQYQAKNPDMLFDVEWKASGGGYWNCVAPGYGERGNYGSGSIFVRGKEVECLKPRYCGNSGTQVTGGSSSVPEFLHG